MRGFLINWGHGVPFIVKKNLPLKFGLKQSTLKIWVFWALGSGFHVSPLELEMDLEKNYHVFRKFSRWIWIHLKRWTKLKNLFEIGEDWFFSQICLETEISRKSRQISTETILLSCDKIHKGCQNLYFVFQNFIFPYPHKSTTLTNWRHWKQTISPPKIHLLQNWLRLAHFLSAVG